MYRDRDCDRTHGRQPAELRAQGGELEVRVRGQVQLEVFRLDESVIGEGHVELSGTTWRNVRELVRRLHGDHWGRDARLERRLQVDRVLVLDLGRDDRPGVGYRLAADERLDIRRMTGNDGLGRLVLVVLG